MENKSRLHTKLKKKQHPQSYQKGKQTSCLA